MAHLTDDKRIKKWPPDTHVKPNLKQAGSEYVKAQFIQYILFKIEREVMRKSGYHDSELTNFKKLNRETCHASKLGGFKR